MKSTTATAVVDTLATIRQNILSHKGIKIM